MGFPLQIKWTDAASANVRNGGRPAAGLFEGPNGAEFVTYHPDFVVSPKSVLGGDSLVLERTIDVHIRSLGKKLGPHSVLVDTVRGIGYSFSGPAGVEA